MPATDAASSVRTVLFYRDFRQFHGGHLKVWDYFNHVRAAPGFEPKVAFSERSDQGPSNPWSANPDAVVGSLREVEPNVLFVAGRDWLAFDGHPGAEGRPIINLVQGLRHADPESDRFQFLRRRAIRICVSDVVAEAVRSTGIVRGPVLSIPNAIDVEALAPYRGDARDVDLVIAALKAPQLGEVLGRELARQGRRVEVLKTLLPRSEYLALVGRARAAILLPHRAEGFYLPPLEAMALGTLVVCPRYEGPQTTYAPGKNCLRPAYEARALAEAAEAALAMEPAAAAAMRAAAEATAKAHGVDRERKAFLEILHALDELWRSS